MLLWLQGWVISKAGWQAPQTFPEESISIRSRLDLDSSSGTTDVSDSAAEKKGPLRGDHLQSQDSGMVARKAAGVNEPRETEGVIELRHHSGLFTHTIFSTGKEACPVDSMLQIDGKAIDEVTLCTLAFASSFFPMSYPVELKRTSRSMATLVAVFLFLRAFLTAGEYRIGTYIEGLRSRLREEKESISAQIHSMTG
jgi:hypothetical protein